jgi:hypothetical protein
VNPAACKTPISKSKRKTAGKCPRYSKKGTSMQEKFLSLTIRAIKLNDDSELNSGPNFFVESHYSYPRKKYRINTRDQVKSNPKFSNKKLDITTSEENPKNLYFSRNFIDVKDFQVKRPEFYDREPVGAKKSANKMLLEMQLRKIGPIEDSDRKGAGSYIQTDDFIERSDNGHTADKTQRESFKYCIRPS